MIDHSTKRSEIRKAFVDRIPFALDPFQVEALDAIDSGHSVLVAAPTGSGKTLVAEYAVAVAMAEGSKVFYTTPLKALSNQKYHDLVRVHGTANVGLLTGDTVINGDAPAVVMTTEVLRNMIYANSPALDRLSFVVLDEVHYLQNAYRGPVWEEVIIHSPPEVNLVCLSATVSNAEELTDWIQTVRGSTRAIIEEKRPVTLNQHYLVARRGSEELTMLPAFTESGRPNPRATALDDRSAGRPWRKPQVRSHHMTPLRTDVVEHLRAAEMLPAIYFIFSRNACDDAVRQCLNEGVRLTTPDERERIRAIAETKVEALSDEDLRVLDYGVWLTSLEAGVAAHHAGMVPPLKEAVEACFAEALVKVVFATETLALGINMPARTVVIEKLSKFTGERHEFLTPGEYTQLTGRAGRRGIDDVGHAVVLWSRHVAFEQVAGLASTRSYTLTSSFRPTYNMAVNLVRRYPADVAHHLLNLSFAQYRADADVVRLETQLERATGRIAVAEASVECEHGDVRAWAESQRLAAIPEKREEPGRVSSAISDLKVGDVIRDPGSDEDRHIVVISTSQRRGHDTRIGVLTREGRRFNLVPKDFARAPHRVHHLELPMPFNPGNRDFIKRAAASLRDRVGGEEAPFVPRGKRVGRPSLSHDPAHQSVTSCPDFKKHSKALTEVDKLTRERERLEKRVMSRTESLARQFDRVLGLLRDLGYVDGWMLTEAGESLSRVYHEADLLVVECLRRGIFEGLTPPAVAALASSVVYESRGPAGSGPTPFFHTKAVRQGWATIEAIWKELASFEQESALPVTRAPDPGFCAFAYAWVAGEDLENVLADEDMSGGDFVRNVKQLIDLLRQIAGVTTSPSVTHAARKAADELFRGIVVASSIARADSGEDGGASGEPEKSPVIPDTAETKT